MAVALAGEVVGSAEVNFLGLPLRFSLQPGGDEAFSSDIGRVPRLSEAGKLVPGGGDRGRDGRAAGTGQSVAEVARLRVNRNSCEFRYERIVC